MKPALSIAPTQRMVVAAGWLGDLPAGAACLRAAERVGALLAEALAPVRLVLGAADLHCGRVLADDVPLEIVWGLREVSPASLRVAAWLAAEGDPRPAAQVELTYVFADPVSAGPLVLAAAQRAALDRFR